MNKIKSFFVGVVGSFLVAFSGLSAVILEAPHFSAIAESVTEDAVVIVDIDDTLMVPVQTLGSDVWLSYRAKQHESAGLTHYQAYEKALAEWQGVRHITAVRLVEEDIADIIRNLQEQGIVVMGLTNQGLALAERTIDQLKGLNIDLSEKALCCEDRYFLSERGILYRNGILFTSGGAKGAALTKFLEMVDVTPKKVIFIDDKEHHVVGVEKALQARDIECVGLRYSFSDERINNFDKEIADIQWQRSTFQHILSDEEAQEITAPCP